MNRVVGEGQLVDELHLTFTHSRSMPGLAEHQADGKEDLDGRRRGRAIPRDKLACERIYWDHADVLRQAGLLKE